MPRFKHRCSDILEEKRRLAGPTITVWTGASFRRMLLAPHTPVAAEAERQLGWKQQLSTGSRFRAPLTSDRTGAQGNVRCKVHSSRTSNNRRAALALRAMSRPASRASTASLRGVDLAAVQANLRALGHEVDEGQLVSMLRSIDISEVLGRSARGSRESVDHSQPRAGCEPASSAGTASDGRRDLSNGSESTYDHVAGNASGSISSVASTVAAQKRASSCGESYLSDPSADSHSDLSVVQDEATAAHVRRGPSSGPSSVSTSRRSTVSNSTIPAQLSDVPEEDASRSASSWYCDEANSISSSASRRARRAAGRTLRRSSNSGDGMSSMSGAGSASYTSSIMDTPQQPLPVYLYQALSYKMPQTDRLARWRQYQEAWERDPFLTAGGDCKVSKRPRENFGEFFAQEHMLLAMEREAYIRGRGTVYVDDEHSDGVVDL